MESDRILIVDDEEIFRIILKRLVENDLGLRADTANNPKEAFEYLKYNIPILIFMDMQMPYMDGMTAITHIRANERTKDIPIIAFSAMGHEALIVKLAKLKIADFIVKPSSHNTILTKLRNVLKTIGCELPEIKPVQKSDD